MMYQGHKCGIGRVARSCYKHFYFEDSGNLLRAYRDHFPVDRVYCSPFCGKTVTLDNLPGVKKA